MHPFMYSKFRVLYAPASEGGGGGEGIEDTNSSGADDSTGDDDKAALAKLIEEAVAKATEGLKRKNTELIGKTKKLQEDLNAAKNTQPALSDQELQEYRTLKDKMERDEMLRAIAEGKSDEVIAKATSKTRAEYEAKLAAAQAERERLAQEATSARTELETAKISAAITSAAAGAVKPQYQELVERLVRENVRLIDGQVQVVDAQGEPQFSQKGTPMTVAEYVDTLRPTYSDLFLSASGGGASGSPKNRGNSNIISLEAAGEMSMENYIKWRKQQAI
jgi:uncharacterized cupin superfamily protein